MKPLKRRVGRLFRNINTQVREMRSKTPIVVYHIGKVGSSTAAKSLRSVGLQDPVYQVAYLAEGQEHTTASQAEKGMPFAGRYAEKLRRMRRLRQQIAANNRRRWKVITLVRDPMAAAISDLFQTYEKHLSGLSLNRQQSPDELRSIDDIFQRRFEKYYRKYTTWFELELKAVFGFDVLSEKFPKKDGYHIYHGARADLLLIRLEDLSICHSQAFKEFLDISDFRLVNSNEARNKEYDPAYRQFVATVALEPDFLDSMYSIDWVRHFYSPEEIEGFRSKWERNRAAV